MIPQYLQIQEPVFDAITIFGIGGISIIIAVAWIVLLVRNHVILATRLCVGMFSLMFVGAVASLSGILARFDMMPPPMLFLVLFMVVFPMALGLSTFGSKAANQVPLFSLVGLLSFRFPLELVMHRASNIGIMPHQLSFSTGYNFDIITGLSALILFVLHKASFQIPTILIWSWNIWGSLCLIIIFLIAVSTSPIFRLFGDNLENLNTWVLYFPYIWLPTVLVSIAIFSHVVITRKLLSKNFT